MSDVLADTHAIVWYLFDPNRLSATADAAIAAAEQTGRLFISTITLVEMHYLTGKKSFPYLAALSRLYSLVTDPTQPIKAIVLDVTTTQAFERVPKSELPDMPDRIIAATAVAHGLPLVSADSDIQGSASLKSLVQIIW